MQWYMARSVLAWTAQFYLLNKF